jgi:putative two-component system response regulator
MILVAEDDKAIQAIFGSIFVDEDIQFTNNGFELLKAVETVDPSIILLDHNMPGMTGLEVCEKLKENYKTKNIPVILITGNGDFDLRHIAFETGCEDFISKPFVVKEVAARVKRILENNRLLNKIADNNYNLKNQVADQSLEIYYSQLATIRALSKLAESRDDDTGKHIDRVQFYCREIAKLSVQDKTIEVHDSDEYYDIIFNASCLHDIGKVAIPDAILKKPGKLTSDEFDVMKTHSEEGYVALLEAHSSCPTNEILSVGMDITRYHHEKWDGTGYPSGLAGSDIPLSARIMALADVYDALRSKRCYKSAFSHMDAISIIEEGKGTHFDPELCQIFLDEHKKWDKIFSDHS